MRRARLDGGVGGQCLGRLAHQSASSADEPRRDRLLGARAAREQAPFDKQNVGALAHGLLYRLPTRKTSCGRRLAVRVPFMQTYVTLGGRSKNSSIWRGE